MATELTIAGVGVSSEVLATIVTLAAQRVEGVAQVGAVSDLASSLVSVLTDKAVPVGPAVECEQDADANLQITLHLSVFYGYPFTVLAESVRNAVAEAVWEQAAATVATIDICIDSLVFPKE